MATGHLVRSDYRVLKPVTVERYDIVIIDPREPDVFRRVQVKTGRLANGKISSNACSVNSGDETTRRYVGEVDDIAVYCPETDGTYLLPMAVVGDRTKLYMRVTEPRAVRTDLTLLWAKDFLLERVIGVEPTTTCLASKNSTTELHPHEGLETGLEATEPSDHELKISLFSSTSGSK